LKFRAGVFRLETMKSIQLILLAVVLLSSGMAFGQITEDPEDRQRGEQGRDPLRTQTPEGRPLPFSQRIRVGGGVSALQFGNSAGGVPFIIGLSPIVAYQASEKLVLGLGVDYQYARLKAFDATGRQLNLTANQYGGRAFAMYEVGEVANTSIPTRYSVPGQATPSRISVTAPLAGLTYSQRVGRLAGINVSALYNLNYTSQSRFLYNSPFVFRILFF
jgi:hypothetical protein